MIVDIKKPYKYIDTYNIAKYILFWEKKDSVKIDNLANYLFSTRFFTYLRNRSKKPKIVIEKHDLYNLDYTLALIILPSLLLYKHTTNSSPTNLDLEDYPNHLGEFEGWKYILSQMIIAFEKVTDFGNLDDSIQDFKKDEEKIEKGLYLFAKYYRHLWD